MINPWPAVGRLGPQGAKRQAQRHGIAKRRQRSAARGAQDVGASHSTEEAGERHRPGPWGGKGMPGHGPVGGKHGGYIETRFRVYETTTDSRAREAITTDGIHIP